MVIYIYWLSMSLSWSGLICGTRPMRDQAPCPADSNSGSPSPVHLR